MSWNDFRSFFFFLDQSLKISVDTSKTNFNSIGTFNNISLKYPDFSLLTQTDLIDESIYCDENTTAGNHCFDNTLQINCRCVHRLKVNLNSKVELVVANVDDQIPHPIHLHGHKFHILDMGVWKEKPAAGAIKHGTIIPNVTHQNPPYKDTVVLPYPGYVRLRFRADNPGFWLFHCHFDWHLTTGKFWNVYYYVCNLVPLKLSSLLFKMLS